MLSLETIVLDANVVQSGTDDYRLIYTSAHLKNITYSEIECEWGFASIWSKIVELNFFYSQKQTTFFLSFSK